MKKQYIIGGLCCLAGIILLSISLLIVKGDFTKMNSKNIGSAKQQVYECAGDVNKINVVEYAGAVTVKSGDVQRPVIEYKESKSNTYTVTEKDGVVSIEKNKDWNNLFFCIDFNRYEICVTVPKSYSGEFDIKNSSGFIAIDSIRGKELSVTNTSGSITLANVVVEGDVITGGSSGKISLDNIVCNSLNVKNTSGSIKFNSITSKGECSVENSSGSVTINGMEVKGAFDAKNSSGSIKLSDVTAADNVSIGNTSGSITLTSVSSDGSVTAKNTSGGIRFENLRSAGDIRMSSTSGSITGTILGKESDYSISASSSSGSCNLKNSNAGSKDLQIENHSGRIKVEFIE